MENGFTWDELSFLDPSLLLADIELNVDWTIEQNLFSTQTNTALITQSAPIVQATIWEPLPQLIS